MSESTRKRSSSGQKAGALIAGKIISEALRKKSAVRRQLCLLIVAEQTINFAAMSVPDRCHCFICAV